MYDYLTYIVSETHFSPLSFHVHYELRSLNARISPPRALVMMPASFRRLSSIPLRSLSQTSPLPPPRLYSTAERTSDRIATNDPNPPKPAPNVSETNELPVDTAGGLRDAPLQEMRVDAEHQRQMQAPNREKTWSRSQAPRDLAMSGPRFEQTIMGLQVDTLCKTQLECGGTGS